MTELWDPKYRVRPRRPIATFGSCFAQHFAAALRKRGYNWLDAEPVAGGIDDDTARRFGYRVFSARTGNIYTASLLLQWTRWALGLSQPPDEVWTEGTRFIDPFRPTIEPGGFASRDELLALRASTIAAFRRCIEDSGVLVFTLGLTESWAHVDGHEYPMCPGTAGGTFDPDRHRFENQKFRRVRAALTEAIALMRQANPKLRILLTVSPVPLTATNSGQHVLVATGQSKAVLRAVAWDVADSADYIDYFPSYEIINAPGARGAFFQPNLRSVTQEGVDFVMQSFFESQTRKFGPLPDAPYAAPNRARARQRKAAQDVICDEEILDAFSGTP
jgi:hypothetical protein